MGVYTNWVDGYLIESTFGTSDIANTNTQTYSLGVISEDAIHPTPETSMVFGGTGVNSQEVSAGKAWKTVFTSPGTYTVGMINGVLLWFVMGKSSTAGSDPYTHTITPSGATSGVLDLLPSFTIQHDLTGTASDWGIQFKGVKVARLELMCGWDTQYLFAVVDWLAKTAATAGFVSTNTPAFPTTANETPYTFSNMTATFDGNSFRDNLRSINFTIYPDMSPWLDNTLWLKSFIEGERKQYELKFTWSPTGSTFFDELIGTGNTKDTVIKWTRSANDYIQLTLSDCHVVSAPFKTPKTGTSLLQDVTIIPERLSIEVKDSIAGNAGGAYGE
ncbi:MAG: hypothetical protein ACXADF_17700 [Candidatus Thorarchaeota archaeon]|jgi:hypothetical protein